MNSRLACLAALALLLSACATAPKQASPPAPAAPARPVAKACVDCGRVERIETVHGQPAPAHKGPVLGGVVGSVLTQPAKPATPTAGAPAAPEKVSYRLTLRMDDGRRLVVNQNLISSQLRVGSVVRYTGGRVVFLR